MEEDERTKLAPAEINFYKSTSKVNERTFLGGLRSVAV